MHARIRLPVINHYQRLPGRSHNFPYQSSNLQNSRRVAAAATATSWPRILNLWRHVSCVSLVGGSGTNNEPPPGAPQLFALNCRRSTHWERINDKSPACQCLPSLDLSCDTVSKHKNTYHTCRDVVHSHLFWTWTPTSTVTGRSLARRPTTV